jgi:hypothetical protein
MGIGCLTPSPCRFTPRNTRFVLHGRLGGPQGISGRARKIPPQPEFDPRSVQDVATRHTDRQPYTGIGTEMNLSGLAGFLAQLFEGNRIRGHGVMPNNPWHVEGECF